MTRLSFSYTASLLSGILLAIGGLSLPGSCPTSCQSVRAIAWNYATRILLTIGLSLGVHCIGSNLQPRWRSLGQLECQHGPHILVLVHFHYRLYHREHCRKVVVHASSAAPSFRWSGPDTVLLTRCNAYRISAALYLLRCGIYRHICERGHGELDADLDSGPGAGASQLISILEYMPND